MQNFPEKITKAVNLLKLVVLSIFINVFWKYLYPTKKILSPRIFFWKMVLLKFCLNNLLMLLIQVLSRVESTASVTTEPLNLLAKKTMKTMPAKLNGHVANVFWLYLWKTHWALGHPVQSGNVFLSQISFWENILLVWLLWQVSDKQESTTLCSGVPVVVMNMDTVREKKMRRSMRRLWIVG